MSSLSVQLKTATQSLHAEMESLPFFRALADGSLPMDSYLNQLRAFAVVFASLERSAAAAADASVRDLSAPLQGRYLLLLQDLEVFSDLLLAGIAPAVQRSLNLAHAIRLCAAERPRILVGHLYALGGTMLGNRVHLGDVRRVLQGVVREQARGRENVQGDAFYTGFGERTDEAWHTLSALLDHLDVEDEERLLIVTTAQQSFRELIAIHAALFPLPPPEERKLAATALNPEAGSHPIPDDLREVRAALAAGRLCRAEFPYFDARYGERGKRYTSSDVAWLATLPQLETAGIIQQATWLADLLARLGMPRILLERQLELLMEELTAAVPERRERYERLEAGVEALRLARLSRLSGQQFAELASQVERSLASRDPGVANLGVLIVSSLTDEACGIEESAQALETWLAQSGSFPAGMSGAVKEAFSQVRARLKVGG